MRKYVQERWNNGEASREVITAVLSSDSPVVSWQTEDGEVQWTEGKSGERPGREMLRERREPSGVVGRFAYHTEASGPKLACRSS